MLFRCLKSKFSDSQKTRSSKIENKDTVDRILSSTRISKRSPMLRITRKTISTRARTSTPNKPIFQWKRTNSWWRIKSRNLSVWTLKTSQMTIYTWIWLTTIVRKRKRSKKAIQMKGRNSFRNSTKKTTISRISTFPVTTPSKTTKISQKTEIPRNGKSPKTKNSPIFSPNKNCRTSTLKKRP